jgi:flagellar FliL protein
MTDYAISKKSKRSLWIPILVFITLAACASAGYSYWHSHQVAADDKAQQRVVPSMRWIPLRSIWAMQIAYFISA